MSSQYTRGYKHGILGLTGKEIVTDYLAGFRAGKADRARIIEERETPKQYKGEKGYTYFVSDGISEGQTYMTVYRKPGATGSHRVKSHLLPPRATPVEAQEDLDIYAAIKGWWRIEEGGPET